MLKYRYKSVGTPYTSISELICTIEDKEFKYFYLKTCGVSILRQ